MNATYMCYIFFELESKRRSTAIAENEQQNIEIAVAFVVVSPSSYTIASIDVGEWVCSRAPVSVWERHSLTQIFTTLLNPRLNEQHEWTEWKKNTAQHEQAKQKHRT